MKGALFDLDGVIIDSESIYTDFWQSIDRMYPTGIDNFAIKIKGTTLPSILPYFRGPEIQADIVRRLDDLQRNMRYNIYPYVEDFISELHRRNTAVALVTSSDQRKMHELFAQLPHLRNHFDAIIDAECVTHSKPHPEPYIKGAEALGLDPKDCYVFEDSLQGIAAGKAAGAYVIGLSTTYPVETLLPVADVVIADFQQALKLISSPFTE